MPVKVKESDCGCDIVCAGLPELASSPTPILKTAPRSPPSCKRHPPCPRLGRLLGLYLVAISVRANRRRQRHRLRAVLLRLDDRRADARAVDDGDGVLGLTSLKRLSKGTMTSAGGANGGGKHVCGDRLAAAEKTTRPPLSIRRGAALLYQVTVDNELRPSVDPRRPTRGESAFQTDLCVFERKSSEGHCQSNGRSSAYGTACPNPSGC